MSETAAHPAGLTIEQYDRADYERLYDLWRASDLWLRPSDSRDQLELRLERDPDLFLVARVAEALVGTGMGGWDGRRAYVYHLAVDPQWRRRGVGGALMDELEARFRARGALKVKCQVLVGNQASHAFFAARGYRVEDDCIPVGKELIEGGAPADWSPC